MNLSKKQKRVDLRDEWPDIEDESILVQMLLELEEQREWMYSLLKKTGEKCRGLIHLFYFEGKSYGEIAKLLHVTPGALRKRKHDCLTKLRELLL